ncbi:amino acid ABC transporter substrate-binding protein [Methanobrevibacter sp.]|uniref:amino acid ABC transporter substrate-binding protein n=1 Tax=Methanobrevibacter sp. TaxID=66852 RepID=UPI00388EFD46
MNKKIIVILTLMMFLVMNTSAAGFLDFFNETESSGTNNDTTLVVGLNPVFPPFVYKDDSGNNVGFDLEIAKEVCDRNNWTLKETELIDWNSKEFEVNSGEIDCIWGAFTIDGREDEYLFTEPYYNNAQVVVVKSDSNINSLSDLKGKNVEIQTGSSAISAINNNTTLKNSLNNLFEVENNNVAMMDLESGTCDAVIMDNGFANYYITNKYPSCKILSENVSDEKYGIGFKKGNAELRDAVQKTLDEMFKDGTVEKIAQNYSDYKLEQGLIKGL